MDRAFLVGINAYPGHELNGCVNDVNDMANFLVSHCGFNEGDIRLLTDARATTDAIKQHLQWLITGAKAGDRLAFHYSGHGAQFPTRNVGGKVNEVHECICPVDFDWTPEHAILDTEFNGLFAKVAKNVDLTWISDSCFSGDLARDFLLPGRNVKAMPMPADIAWRMRTAATDTKGVKVTSFEHVIKDFSAVLISGCTAHQTSADANIDGRYNGALTYYLLKTLSAPNGLSQTLEEAVARTQAALRQGGYAQRPQLEGSEDLMNRPFLSQSKHEAKGSFVTRRKTKEAA